MLQPREQRVRLLSPVGIPEIIESDVCLTRPTAEPRSPAIRLGHGMAVNATCRNSRGLISTGVGRIWLDHLERRVRHEKRTLTLCPHAARPTGFAIGNVLDAPTQNAPHRAKNLLGVRQAHAPHEEHIPLHGRSSRYFPVSRLT